MEKEALWTKKEVLAYLRISPGTLRKLMNRNQIPYIKLERKVLFKKSDIDRWLESKMVK